MNDPALDRMSVLAGAVSVTIEHDQDDGFDDSLRRVVAATGTCRETLWGVKFLERGPGRSYRLSQAMMTLVLGTMFRSGKFPPIFMNIGVLDDSRLKFGGIAACCGSCERVYSQGTGLRAHRQHVQGQPDGVDGQLRARHGSEDG